MTFALYLRPDSPQSSPKHEHLGEGGTCRNPQYSSLPSRLTSLSLLDTRNYSYMAAGDAQERRPPLSAQFASQPPTMPTTSVDNTHLTAGGAVGSCAGVRHTNVTKGGNQPTNQPELTAHI